MVLIFNNNTSNGYGQCYDTETKRGCTWWQGHVRTIRFGVTKEEMFGPESKHATERLGKLPIMDFINTLSELDPVECWGAKYIMQDTSLDQETWQAFTN